MKYSPPLDGLRALCVGLTVVNHIGPHPRYLNGNLGVVVFFVLSGFLITTLLVNERDRSSRICLSCFYIRRFFRIVPLYYLTLLLYVGASLAAYVIADDPHRWQQLKAAAPAILFFMGEYRAQAAGTFFGHSWTLGIEEKYYLIWPLLFAFPRHVSSGWAKGMLSVSIVALWTMLPDPEAVGYGGLAIGSLVGLICSGEAKALSRRITAVHTGVYGGMVLASYALTLIFQGAKISCFLAMSSALLIATLVSKTSLTWRLLSIRPLVYVGQRTYAVYLIHVLVANAVIVTLRKTLHWENWFATYALTLAVSILAASALKVLLEKPLMTYGRTLASGMAQRRAAAAVADGA